MEISNILMMEKFKTYSDSDWLELMKQSVTKNIIDGFQFPLFQETMFRNDLWAVPSWRLLPKLLNSMSS
jgi:hypothetical protein